MQIKKEDGQLDEMWTKWWNCPICGYNLISYDSKYCGGCGQGIDWVETAQNLLPDHSHTPVKFRMEKIYTFKGGDEDG